MTPASKQLVAYSF